MHSSDTFSHANSTTGSYDSQHPSDIAGRQMYDAIGNGNSGIPGSILSEALGGSSMNSSFAGTAQESLVDVHSRKASLTSIHEAQFPNSLVQSPEYEDQSAATAVSGWHSASSSISQVSKAVWQGKRYLNS